MLPLTLKDKCRDEINFYGTRKAKGPDDHTEAQTPIGNPQSICVEFRPFETYLANTYPKPPQQTNKEVAAG